jgi:sulfatase maturation enzyme AslB (radical SAM superfamily)
MNLFNLPHTSPAQKRFVRNILLALKSLMFWRFPLTGTNVKNYQFSRPLGPMKSLCYAPFKNVFITTEGRLQPCCLNTTYTYGILGQNSLKDVFLGNTVKTFRNPFLNGGLHPTCHQCQKSLLSGNYGGMSTMFYDTAPLHNVYPTMLELELSNKCNLKCIMCPERLSSQKSTLSMPVLSEDLILNELKQIIPHLKTVKFLGGEPFLIDVYFKIWSLILDINPKCIIQIQTNATVLNDNIKNLLQKGRFRIGVSVDSFERKTYESIRINAHFDSVMTHVNYFATHARKHKYTFSVSVCPLQQNWQELPLIVQKCNMLGAVVFFNSVTQPKECALKDWPSEKLKKVYSTLTSSPVSATNAREKENKMRYLSLLAQIKGWENDARAKEEEHKNLLRLFKDASTETFEDIFERVLISINNPTLETKATKIIQSIGKDLWVRLVLLWLLSAKTHDIANILSEFDTESLINKTKEKIEELKILTQVA